MNGVLERLRQLPRRVGGPHKWVNRLSSQLGAVPLKELDFAAACAETQAVYLALHQEQTMPLVRDEGGTLVRDVPSVNAVQMVRARRLGTPWKPVPGPIPRRQMPMGW